MNGNVSDECKLTDKLESIEDKNRAFMIHSVESLHIANGQDH
jgi:hypothetical protein